MSDVVHNVTFVPPGVRDRAGPATPKERSSMTTLIHHDMVGDRAAFDAYCVRHAIDADAAISELVTMALGLPVDILDYLRAERCVDGAAA